MIDEYQSFLNKFRILFGIVVIIYVYVILSTGIVIIIVILVVVVYYDMLLVIVIVVFVILLLFLMFLFLFLLFLLLVKLLLDYACVHIIYHVLINFRIFPKNTLIESMATTFESLYKDKTRRILYKSNSHYSFHLSYSTKFEVIDSRQAA